MPRADVWFAKNDMTVTLTGLQSSTNTSTYVNNSTGVTAHIWKALTTASTANRLTTAAVNLPYVAASNGNYRGVFQSTNYTAITSTVPFYGANGAVGTPTLSATRAKPAALYGRFDEELWYLFPWDMDRKAMRNFVLTRLSEPKLSGKRFKRPKGFDPDDYLKGSFTVFKGQDDYEVVVDFDGWATDLICGRTWHASQELTELPDGCSRLRFRLNNIVEMERWVLSWGTHATVVRPKTLAERIRGTAADLATRYAEFSPPPPRR